MNNWDSTATTEEKEGIRSPNYQTLGEEERALQHEKIGLMNMAMVLGSLWGFAVLVLLIIIALK